MMCGSFSRPTPTSTWPASGFRTRSSPGFASASRPGCTSLPLTNAVISGRRSARGKRHWPRGSEWPPVPLLSDPRNTRKTPDWFLSADTLCGPCVPWLPDGAVAVAEMIDHPLITPVVTAKSFEQRRKGRLRRETIRHMEDSMRRSIDVTTRSVHRIAVTLAIVSAIAGIAAQSVHEAPAEAPSTGRVAPPAEPGQALRVSGIVVGRDGAPVSGASLYIYQTDHEGYYGVKPASDNRESAAETVSSIRRQGRWSFETVKPGSYPNSRVPPHIHFEVSAAGRAPEDLRDRVRG